MAEGLTATSEIEVDIADLGHRTIRGSRALVLAGNNYLLEHVQEIGTTEEAVTMGDVVAGGLVQIENLDGTNFVQLYTGAGGTALIRLEPGDPPCQFRLDDGATLYARANTAACRIKVSAFDP